MSTEVERDDVSVKTTVHIPTSDEEQALLQEFRDANATTEMALADLYVLAKSAWLEGRRGVPFTQTSFFGTMTSGLEALDDAEEPQ